MLPIQFALELETAINNQIDVIAVSVTAKELEPIINLVKNFQDEFKKLLSHAANVDTDYAAYPPIDPAQLLGLETAWQQSNLQSIAWETNIEVLSSLWSISVLIERSAQFYQQASLNSANPTSRLFFRSLSEVKKIVRIRLGTIIQSYYNYCWGELGFAPFLLGKD